MSEITEAALIAAMDKAWNMPLPDTLLVSFWPFTTIQEVSTRGDAHRVQIWHEAVRRAEAQLAIDWKWRP